MTFIEGIGDEVTAFFVILIVVILATLVTLIGSGPHLYSPVHTRAVHIAVVSSREPAEDAAAQPPERTPPNTSPPQTNSSSPPYESLNADWQSPGSNNYNQQEPAVQTTNDSVEDVSDDTEDQSSSDEGRGGENDTPRPETPTAPSEQDVNEDAEEDSHSAQGIRIRLKYLDDTERTVRSSPVTKIGDFKRNHFPEDLANNKVVRLIFCGHLLRDASTLESCRVVDNSVLHVQILQAQAPDRGQARASAGQQGDQLLDLSHLLWPLVSVVLGVCWVFYFKYPEFFSVISLSLLFVFTASFFVFYTHVHQ